ncbi:uncharacterized protein DS421_3g85330 [Arachis hypogaea]|nr:uncharacterized protein DS421_3g85330 [Arachis hypogaea]
MRKQGTKHYFGAKKTKEKKQRVPPPSFELGTPPFGNIALPSTRAGQHFVVHGQRTTLTRTKGVSASKHARIGSMAHHDNSALPSTRAGQHPAAS